MKEIYHFCLICDKPIYVGDPAFEIGLREPDKEVICPECRDSIVKIDTEVADNV